MRADIQTIRALAVGLVILNHLWPGDLPGGYLGVDVFFVLSGYLITSHLRRESDTTGTIKLFEFWAKRAKRLLPAALVVLVTSAIITTTLVPLLYQQSAFRQIGAAGSYFLNWWLVAESADYFASSEALSPVTHYWSLSVEEQFYIVWPLVILAALWLTRSRSPRARKSAILVAMSFIFVASLAWAIYSTTQGHAGAYFATTGRAWEFAAGALITFAPTTHRINRHVVAGVSWIMWITLIACAFAFGPTSGFPGAVALIPVAATALLLWLPNEGTRWAPQHLLAVRPATFAGDISYSLYLWHWPLVVAATYALGGQLTGVQKVTIIVSTVALAWVTKKFVEDPVRCSRLPPLKRPSLVLVATVTSIAFLWSGLAIATPDVDERAQAAVTELNGRTTSGDPCFGARAAFADCPESSTLVNLDYALMTRELRDLTVSNGSLCMYDWGKTELSTCSFGVKEGIQRRNVALVGDSHAALMAFPLDSVASAHGLRVYPYVAEACAAMDDETIAIAESTDEGRSRQCNEWRGKVVRELETSPEIDTIVTTSFDSAYFRIDAPTVGDSGDGYVRAWQRWLDAGKTVIVINDVPRHPQSVPECILTSSALVDPCTIQASELSTYGPLATAAARIDHPNFHFIDHRGVFCDEDLCRTVIGGIPAYIDSNHMTNVFARSFGEQMFPPGAFDSD